MKDTRSYYTAYAAEAQEVLEGLLNKNLQMFSPLNVKYSLFSSATLTHLWLLLPEVCNESSLYDELCEAIGNAGITPSNLEATVWDADTVKNPLVTPYTFRHKDLVFSADAAVQDFVYQENRPHVEDAFIHGLEKIREGMLLAPFHLRTGKSSQMLNQYLGTISALRLAPERLFLMMNFDSTGQSSLDMRMVVQETMPGFSFEGVHEFTGDYPEPFMKSRYGVSLEEIKPLLTSGFMFSEVCQGILRDWKIAVQYMEGMTQEAMKYFSKQPSQQPA